jgi:hypothetical protein
MNIHESIKDFDDYNTWIRAVMQGRIPSVMRWRIPSVMRWRIPSVASEGSFFRHAGPDSFSRIFDAPSVMRGRNPATLQPRNPATLQPHNQFIRLLEYNGYKG